MSDSRQQENLIAYLDGELTDEAAASVEKTLAEQVAARQEVEKLTRTWELLDLLPEGRASHGFTEKTLTAVRTKLATPTQSQTCLLYTSPSPRDREKSRMPSSA